MKSTNSDKNNIDDIDILYLFVNEYYSLYLYVLPIIRS